VPGYYRTVSHWNLHSLGWNAPPELTWIRRLTSTRSPLASPFVFAGLVLWYFTISPAREVVSRLCPRRIGRIKGLHTPLYLRCWRNPTDRGGRCSVLILKQERGAVGTHPKRVGAAPPPSSQAVCHGGSKIRVPLLVSGRNHQPSPPPGGVTDH